MSGSETPNINEPDRIAHNSDVESKRKGLIETLALLVVRWHRRQERSGDKTNVMAPLVPSTTINAHQQNDP